MDEGGWGVQGGNAPADFRILYTITSRGNKAGSYRKQIIDVTQRCAPGVT